MDKPPASHLREIRERMDSLDGRVRKIEEENDSAGAAILNAEKDIRSIKDTLGEPPSEKRPGSGLTRDVAELKGQIGHAPNEALGTDGEGMARTLSEVRTITKKLAESAEKQANKPVDFLRKVQTVSAILGTIVIVGTIFSGCGAVVVWLFKTMPKISGG